MSLVFKVKVFEPNRDLVLRSQRFLCSTKRFHEIILSSVIAQSDNALGKCYEHESNHDTDRFEAW